MFASRIARGYTARHEALVILYHYLPDDISDATRRSSPHRIRNLPANAIAAIVAPARLVDQHHVLLTKTKLDVLPVYCLLTLF